MNTKSKMESKRKKDKKQHIKLDAPNKFVIQRRSSFTEVPFRRLFRTISNLSFRSNSGSSEKLTEKSNSYDVIPDSYFNRPLVSNTNQNTSSVAYRSANGPLRLIKSAAPLVENKTTSIHNKLVEKYSNPVSKESKSIPEPNKISPQEAKYSPPGTKNSPHETNYCISETISNTPKTKSFPQEIKSTPQENKTRTQETKYNSKKTKYITKENSLNKDIKYFQQQTTFLTKDSKPLNNEINHIPHETKVICKESNILLSNNPVIVVNNIKTIANSKLNATDPINKERIIKKKSTIDNFKTTEKVDNALGKLNIDEKPNIFTYNREISENNILIPDKIIKPSFKLSEIYTVHRNNTNSTGKKISNTKNYSNNINDYTINPIKPTVTTLLNSLCKTNINKSTSLGERPPIPPQHKIKKFQTIKTEEDNNNTTIKVSNNDYNTPPYKCGNKIRADQLIRDEQEKTLTQLHEKHLKEIHDLRNKFSHINTENNLKKDTEDKQDLFFNRSYSITESPTDSPKNIKKKGILKKSSSNRDNSEDEKTLSFSGYLKRSRSKDSIGSKDENSNSKPSNQSELKDSTDNNDNSDHSIDNTNLECSLLKANEIKIRKVEFSEPVENIINSITDDEVEEIAITNQSSTKVNDLKYTPNTPPRSERRQQKKISNFNDCNDMKQNRQHRSVKEIHSRNKDPAENTHPPLQKVSKGGQYKTTEFNETPFEMCFQENKKTEVKSKPVEVPEVKIKEKQSDSITSPPVPPARVNKSKDDISKNYNTDKRRQSRKEEKISGLLLTACANGEEDEVTKLIKDMTKGSLIETSALNEMDVAGRTALSHCCSGGYRRAVEILTAQPNVEMNLCDSEGNGPLHHAAQGGHIDVVSHLVNTCSRQIDLNARNIHGFTPLMKAAIQGRTKIAKILLFAGASPHLRDYGRGLNAYEWARYTGRGVCSDLIDSVQRSCSSYIKDRWTNEEESRPGSGNATPTQQLYQYGPDKNSWFKHKIKKAFHKSDSRKEFSVASNLSTLATCISSPLVSVPTVSTEGPAALPKVKVTEVSVPDCYNDPEEQQSPVSEAFSTGYTSSSNPTTPD